MSDLISVIIPAYNAEKVIGKCLTSILASSYPTLEVIVVNDGAVVFDDVPENVFSRIDDLHLLGLEAPQGAELIGALRVAGVKIDGCPLREDECVEAIYKAICGE